MSNINIPEDLVEIDFDDLEEQARIHFNSIADQADLDAQAGLFGVYLSAIDYDDEYYTLLNAIEAYRSHEFQYAGGMNLVFKTDNLQKAQDVAEDLHQVILRATSIQEFQDRHGLQLQAEVIEDLGCLHDCRDFSLFHRDWDFNVISWCQDQDLSFEFLNNDMGSDGDFFEAQEEVCQELLSNQDFDRLDQLRSALKIGKFTFVHPTQTV